MDEEKKHPGGRPTKYNPEYVEQARKLCLMGATNEQLADFFDVAVSTIHLWRDEHELFSDAIKSAKTEFDENVEKALYHRAIGYTHPEEKVFQYNGDIITHQTEKHYPPDTAAAFIWLKNRQPERWRDRQEIEHSGNKEKPLVFQEKKLSREELEQLDRITEKLEDNES